MMNCVKALKAGWDAFSDVNVGPNLRKAFKKFVAVLPEKITKYMSEIEAWSYSVNKERFPDMGNEHRSFVLDIPFLLYYQLMSSKTTGYYTLPYSGKVVDSSNG